MRDREICFPVIRRVIVKNYAIFPGSNPDFVLDFHKSEEKPRQENGLSHDFINGVTVIAGINGLGKTTLLNIILRLLIGPLDRSKEDPNDIGSGVHELRTWRTPRFFSSRVPDGAVDAEASAEIWFGRDRIEVTRALANLQIRSLRVNDQNITPDESQYKSAIERLSGLPDFVDFHFIVRNLIFCLEDRRNIIWTASGQFDLARILFAGKVAAGFRKQLDDANKKDGEYRRQLHSYNRLVSDLERERKRAAVRPGTEAAIAALKVALGETERRTMHISERIDAISNEIRACRDDILTSRLHLETKVREHERLEAEYVALAFPSADTTIKYVLSHLISSHKCAVCGSADSPILEDIKSRVEAGHCPVCDSPPSSQENIVSGEKVSAERVNRAAKELDAARRALEIAEHDYHQLISEEKELSSEKKKLQERRREQLHELHVRGADLPQADEQIRQLEASLELASIKKDQLEDARSAAFQKAQATLNVIREKIELSHSKVRDYFEIFVREFVAEKCLLSMETRREIIGQSGSGGSLQFPGFQVTMTSGVFEMPQIRRGPETVSESQKEFIDLAYRMALIATVSEGTGGAMIVLETPEASLDTFFINSAGQLLRKFADRTYIDGENDGMGNVLIASSNLNAANMIRALLGVDDETTEVSDRVINLLELAAPNAMLKAHPKEYFAELKKAVGLLDGNA